jgi:anti-sigma factor RsiW
MNCKQALLSLDAFVDQELQPSEMARVKDHLSRCDSCRREETEARALKQLLSRSEAPEPSSGFEDRLISAVLGSVEPVKAPARGRVFRFALLAGASAATLTFVALAMNRSAGEEFADRTQVREDIGQDLYYVTSSDPLGPRAMLPASYDKR